MSLFRRAARRHPGPRRFGLGELVIVAAGIVLALGLLGFTSRSVATFDVDIPLATATDDVSLSIWQARDAVFEKLGDDTEIDVEAQIYDKLDDAATDCRGLVEGRQTPDGFVKPLSKQRDRDIATSLCRDVDRYRILTQSLLDDPAGKGEGSPFDIEIDTLFHQVIAETDALTLSLDRSIAGDVSRLRNLGRLLALSSVVIAVAVALIVGRHRRQLAKQSQELADFGAIFRSTGDAVVSLSVEGVIRGWNPGAASLYGYSPAEIIGRHGSTLVPERLVGEFVERWMPVSRGEGTTTFETLGVRKDGSELPLALTVSPIFVRDKLTGVSVISRDMTDRVMKEAELATARNAALEASRLKSEFLATMSHEIRTPLNGVLGLNALLLETPLTETQLQYAEGVQGAGDALLLVINDILDFSKLEAGKVELELVPFDPRLLVEEVAGLLSVPAHTKGLEILAHCSPDVPAGLVGDVSRIRQILFNLAGNAVKFTPSGEVSIRAHATTSDEGQPGVRFEVRDTGIGIADEGRQRLFESFSQADASTTRRFGGTGLGLAISQRLVDAMGGQIGVESVLGEGSEFWFSLSLPEAPASALPPPPARRDLLPGVRVLIVDDNATNRLILLTELTAWRMLPDAVSSAEDALTRLRAAAVSGQPYAIAVLDMMMPGMDGLELARLMAADPTLSHTRKIMLTSSAHVDPGGLAAAGIVEWCAKPVRSSVLYDRLMRLMAVGSPTQPIAKAPVADAPIRPSQQGHILVVEDNAINQLVAEGMLAKLGYDVTMVSNGVEALAAITARRYSVVLMDCHMPVMDGFEATRQIRLSEGDDTRRLPIIAMTAGAMEEDRERCLAAGMDAYVSKPVSIKALAEALTHWTSSVTGDDAAPPPLVAQTLSSRGDR